MAAEADPLPASLVPHTATAQASNPAVFLGQEDRAIVADRWRCTRCRQW